MKVLMTLVLAATLTTEIAQAQEQTRRIDCTGADRNSVECRSVEARNRSDLQTVVDIAVADEEVDENERYRLRETEDPNDRIGRESSRQVGDVRVRPFYSSRWKNFLLPNERREIEEFGSCVSYYCAHRNVIHRKTPGVNVRVAF